jgi:two-component system, chemotaxis family, protein-glutamate methylesterase/glutaminase
LSSIEIVAIGASLGGLHALQSVLRRIPASFGCSVVIAQHRRADADSRLRELLAGACKLPVIEPEDRTPLEPNHVYIAPSDYHMLVEHGVLALSIDPPVHHARPSIDVLFESVADAYGAASVGVVLTNSNEDGSRGAAAIKRAGGKVFVQDPDTAESPIGPRAALAKTKVDAVLSLEELPLALTRLCHAPRRKSGGRPRSQVR